MPFHLRWCPSAHLPNSSKNNVTAPCKLPNTLQMWRVVSAVQKMSLMDTDPTPKDPSPSWIFHLLRYKIRMMGTSLGAWWLRIWYCHCCCVGSIPGLGTSVCPGHSEKKKKKKIEFPPWHSGLRNQLQQLRSLCRCRFYFWPSTVS